MGSATVEYRRPEDAKKAIEEYHEAYLDDKVLTVEYDVREQT
jgi:RNA recognition motif-containing protein